MANRYELLNQVLASLFKLGDKSREKYTEVLEDFNIRTLDQLQNFDEKILNEINNKINQMLKTGSKKMGNLYTSKKFDSELDSLFFRNAVKLAEEKEKEEKSEEPPKKEEKSEEPPKEEETTEEKKTPQEESGEESESEEPKKIEDTVKDLQVSILEKVNEVKGFKPGRSEAINFRNSVTKLIEVSESAVKAINEFYEKELGKEQEKSESKTSAKKDMYVVKGTANGKKDETISKPMSEAEAKKLADSLKEDMKKAIPKYRWLKEIRVEKVGESKQR